MAELKTRIAAVLCGMTLAGAGLLSVGTHASVVSLGVHNTAAAAQTTPTTAPCEDDSENDKGANEDSESDKSANADSGDDNEDGSDTEHDAGNGDTETEATAQAGQLSEGQDLLAGAGITVDQAITAATGAAQGAPGDIELKTVDGTLVFDVQIGDADVRVNAADGSIVSVDSGDSDAEDMQCDDSAAATPGASASGSALSTR